VTQRGDLERIKRAIEILAEETLRREYAKDMTHERELRALAWDGWAEFDKVLDEVDKENEG
jgi:hypothetical protein